MAHNWQNMQQFQTMPSQPQTGFQQFQPPHPASFSTGMHGPVGGPPMPPQSLKVKLNPREHGTYSILFSQVDDGRNRIEGHQAVQFFKRSGLPVQTLKEIWNVATSGGETYLDKERFYVSLRLVALAQQGKPVSRDSILNDVQTGLPKFQSNKVVKNIWDIQEHERSEYESEFQKSGGEKGFLSTQQAMMALSKTKLNREYLSKIWNLSDPNNIGTFNKFQFTVAMHLVSRVQKHSEPVPDTLPEQLLKVLQYPADQINYTGEISKSGIKEESDVFSEFQMDFPSSRMSLVSQSYQSTGSMSSISTGNMDISSAPIPSTIREQKAPVNYMETPAIKSDLQEVQPQPITRELKPQIEQDLFDFDSIKPKIEPSKPPVKQAPSEPVIGIPKFEFKEVSSKEQKARKGYSSSSSDVEQGIDIGFQDSDQTLQVMMQKWRDTRQKLSIEREKNQILMQKLQDISKSTLQKLHKEISAFKKQLKA